EALVYQLEAVLQVVIDAIPGRLGIGIEPRLDEALSLFALRLSRRFETGDVGRRRLLRRFGLRFLLADFPGLLLASARGDHDDDDREDENAAPDAQVEGHGVLRGGSGRTRAAPGRRRRPGGRPAGRGTSAGWFLRGKGHRPKLNLTDRGAKEKTRQ